MKNSNVLFDKNPIIYGFGLTGKWISSELGAEYIVDTDIKKWGNSFEGALVKSPDFLKEIDVDTDIVVVTVVDIFDVIPLLNHYGVTWIPLADLFINSQFTIDKNLTGESEEFLRYSVSTVLQCQNASLSADQFYLRSVDLVITEKCTLKCKDCANLMQFYEAPINYNIENIIAGVINLSARTDFIHEIRVIGGEPFLNKDIYKIINRISEIKNINKIVIYTNGMIPPKEYEIKTFNKDKILFSITDYAELGRNLDKTISTLERNGLPYRLHPPEHWTDSGRFIESPLGVEEAKDLFAKCCGKNLYTLIGEKLYRCPFAANAEKINAIPIDFSNSVSITAEASSIKEFAYGIEYIDACRYCPGRSFDSPIIKPAVQVKQPIVYKKYIAITA